MTSHAPLPDHLSVCEMKLTSMCGPCREGVRQQFELMRDALNKTGRNIVYAIDDWGVSNPWEYGISVSPFHALTLGCQSRVWQYTAPSQSGMLTLSAIVPMS